MKKLTFVLLFAAVALPLAGQTTWGGLRFGMTKAEAKAVMEDRDEEIGRPGPELYKPFKIKVGGATGTAWLNFETGKDALERVSLNFSRKSDNGVFAKLSQDEAVDRLMVLDVLQALLKKYGRPTNETGRCPTHDEMLDYLVRRPLATVKCARLWSDPSQTIEMDFFVGGSSLHLTVEYKSRSRKSSEL